MADQIRPVSAETFLKTASNALSRYACEEADPTNGLHDHSVCVHDDISYAADLLLRFATAVATGDEDTLLNATMTLQSAVGGQA